MKKTILLSIAALLGLILILGVFFTRSELIEVEGYQLEVVVKGKDGPTVIFESGFTGGRLLWLLTQHQVSKTATALVYERPGIGKSEVRPEARTASQMAIELYTLLQTLKLSPPYVLVGHSAGGMYMKLFANQHPELIGGMVFVDPATEEFYERWQSSEVNGWAGIEDMLRDIGANAGTLGQLNALPQSIAKTRNISLPNVPTTIMTATKPSSTPLETETDMVFWLESHKRLAASIPNSRHVIYNDKNHMSILFDKHMVEEILAIVNQAR